MKKLFIVTVVIALLAGTGFWISRRAPSPVSTLAPGMTISTEKNPVLDQKIELVNAVTILSSEADALGDQPLRPHSQKRVMEAIATLKSEPQSAGLYIGLLTKCYMPNHDMHYVEDNGTITRHAQTDAVLHGNTLRARTELSKLGGGTVVLLYEKGYAIYGSDGKLISSGNDE